MSDMSDTQIPDWFDSWIHSVAEEWELFGFTAWDVFLERDGEGKVELYRVEMYPRPVTEEEAEGGFLNDPGDSEPKGDLIPDVSVNLLAIQKMFDNVESVTVKMLESYVAVLGTVKNETILLQLRRQKEGNDNAA